MRLIFNIPIPLLLLMVLAGSSCTRTADIVLPPHRPALVVHGYTAVGELFRISLGKTIRSDQWVLDTGTYVNDGWVLLFEDGLFRDSLRFDSTQNMYLTSLVAAQAGKKYKLVAGAPGFEAVEATASSPLQVPTVDIFHIANARTDASGMPLDDVRFSFHDPASETNYYLAALYPPFPATGFVCVYTYDPSVERYTEGLMPFDPSSCIGGEAILFTDKAFNGQVKEITLSASAYSLASYTDPFTGVVHKPYLKRYNITREYYTYFKHSNALDLNSGAPTLMDPIIIKGNVRNGYGLFTVYTSVTDTLP